MTSGSRCLGCNLDSGAVFHGGNDKFRIARWAGRILRVTHRIILLTKRRNGKNQRGIRTRTKVDMGIGHNRQNRLNPNPLILNCLAAVYIRRCIRHSYNRGCICYHRESRAPARQRNRYCACCIHIRCDIQTHFGRGGIVMPHKGEPKFGAFVACLLCNG